MEEVVVSPPAGGEGGVAALEGGVQALAVNGGEGTGADGGGEEQATEAGEEAKGEGAAGGSSNGVEQPYQGKVSRYRVGVCMMV